MLRELDFWLFIGKDELLMEMVEWFEEQWIWKEGWPQPGEAPKGNERKEENGGQSKEDCGKQG